MAFTGYMKIDDIKGESKRADHEDEIDIFGVRWGASQTSSASTGSGRTRGRAVVQDVMLHKYYDAASPYLALACMQGKSFAEIVIAVRKDSGEAHLDYLIVTLSNVIISSYTMEGSGPKESDDDMIVETVALSCEKIGVKYTVQADDHSAGDEHEIEYDLIAGK
jgi:type VI secretion system secreted protein Hcp